MLQPRPTFSESWYRIRDLKARLRSGAQISRQHHRGERCYVVRDPAGNEFYSLSDAAYRFVGLLDGNRSVQQAWDLCNETLGDESPTQPEVIQLLSQLHAANLIEANVTADAAVLLRRHKSMQRQLLQGRFMNLLFPRIPLWDPDRFLKRWLPVMRWVLSLWGGLIWLAVVGSAVAAVLPAWPRLREAAINSIAPGNWPILLATFILIKLIHELGHAFTCRRFGGECHELGLTFLVFIPMPYVDTSGSWSFANPWQRMLVGAAGMLFELFVAGLCCFVWLNTTPGVDWCGIPVNGLAYNTMLVASVSTVLFNANPLLRYDGYYILSDLLEIPNLYQQATEYLQGLVKRHLFRIEPPFSLPPPGERAELLAYAVASKCYWVFVSVMIILVVTSQVPVLGVLMAGAGIVLWLVVPVARLGKYLALDPELHRKRGRAWGFVLAGAACLAVTLGLIRFPTRIYATGMVEPARRERLYMGQSGFVRDIRVADGQKVRRGEVLLKADNPVLDSAVAADRARVVAARAKAMLSLVKDLAQYRIDLLNQKIEQERLADALRRRDELTIRAPFAGRVIGPELRNLQGAYLRRGAPVVMVARYDHLLVRCDVEQGDAELLMGKKIRPEPPRHPPLPAGETASPPPARLGIANEIRLAGCPGVVQQGGAVRVISAGQQELVHRSLGRDGGAEIATDPRDRRGLKSLVPEFEVQVTLANPDLTYLPGQRAYVRFTVGSRPLIWQWSRRFLQLVQAHSRSRWL